MTRFIVLAVVASIGCGPAPKPTTTTTTTIAPSDAAAGDPTCPLLVPGTSISVEDTQSGPAWVFVTTGDVAAVRTRGKALAAMHNDRNGPANAMGMAITGKSIAKVDDIEGGARITYAVAEPTGGAALGDELRMHASHLSGATSCVMGH